jgi:hypothetical protein
MCAIRDGAHENKVFVESAPMIKWTLISLAIVAATLIVAASGFPTSERTHCWDTTEATAS